MFAPAQTLHDVMQQMAGTDLVVATRYHNVVCSLRVGKPTISIGYAEKNDVLLAEMGLGEYCQQIEGLDVDLLKAQILRLISELPALEERVRQAGARFQRSLREQEDLASVLDLRRPDLGASHRLPGRDHRGRRHLGQVMGRTGRIWLERWRPHRDSNPGYRLERATTWTFTNTHAQDLP